MSQLTAKSRNALPANAFALPGRKYPVEDRAHAANALARVTQQVNAGNISSSDAAKVRAKANKKLGKRKP